MAFSRAKAHTELNVTTSAVIGERIGQIDLTVRFLLENKTLQCKILDRFQPLSRWNHIKFSHLHHKNELTATPVSVQTENHLRGLL